MKMKTFAAVAGQFLNETIAPTLPLGIMQGAIGALSAMIAYRPEILQGVVNRFPILSSLAVIQNGEVDVPLLVVAIRGYFSKAQSYKFYLRDKKQGEAEAPYYEVTTADAERFCALLSSFNEAELNELAKAQTSAPQPVPATLPGGLKTPAQVVG